MAVKRLEWLQKHTTKSTSSPYSSVDPAPPSEEKDVGKLRQILMDDSRPLFERYRAMFALRNIGGESAVLALADGESSHFLVFAALLFIYLILKGCNPKRVFRT